MRKEQIDINLIIENKSNPRTIREAKLNKLIKSIEALPQMLEARPIVVNKEMVVLGGNMRLMACKKLGLEKVWVVVADNLTPEQEKEFIIRDNVNHGEWDWEALANEWEAENLNDWGMDVWIPDHEAEFKPVIHPTTKPFVVSEDDFERAQTSFGSDVSKGNTKELVGCTCPNCSYEFNVEKQ